MYSSLKKTQDEIAELSPVNSENGKNPTRQAVAKTQDQIHFDVLEEAVLQAEKGSL